MKALTPNIVLRPVVVSDEEFLFRVYASTREEELSAAPWNDEQKEVFLRMQFVAQDRHYHENYDGATYEVIAAGGEPAGRLYSARWPEEIRIMDIALLPEFRNRGIATKILRDLASESESSGRPLTIHVERFNPALRLYARLGFRPKEDRGVYLLMERPV